MNNTNSQRFKMPETNVPTTRRVAHADLLGRLWMGGVAALQHSFSDDDLDTIGEFSRQAFEDWLDTHTGDFQELIDFSVHVGAETIPWASEDNECQFVDCMYGGERF